MTENNRLGAKSAIVRVFTILFVIVTERHMHAQMLGEGSSFAKYVKTITAIRLNIAACK